MNFRSILSIFNRIFIIKHSVENNSIYHLEKFIDNLKVYGNNYTNLSYNDRIMVHAMISLIN